MKRNLAGLLLVFAVLVLPLQILDSPLQAASQDPAPQAERGDRDGAPKFEYLSPGKRHKIQVSDSEAIREFEAQGGRTVADYGAYKILEVESDDPAALADKPGVEIHDEYNLVLLNAGLIDTTDGEIKDAKMHAEASLGKHMHIVQFAGPIKPEWYASLQATGVEIVSYIPNNAYLAYGNRGSLRRLRSLAESAKVVQWEGEYKEDYKIGPDLRAQRQKGGDLQTQGETSDLFGIQLVDDKGENAATINLIDELKTEEIQSQWDILKYKNFIVRIPSSKVKSIAGRPDVVSIAPYVEPKLRDERQNQIIAGNLTGNLPTPGDWLTYLAGKGFTQGQFTTSGFAVDVGDDGLDNATILPNHPDLYVSGNKANASRVVYARKEGAGSGPEIRGCDGHGTLNTHIIGGFVPFAFGSGFPHADVLGFRFGMGVAPFVRVGSSVIFSPAFTFPNIPDWQSRAYNDGSRISSNSWGASTSGGYNLNSQTFDALVRDAQPAAAAIPAAGNQEMVIVFAAGNDGPGSGTVGAPGTAKNVITLGAAENVHSHSIANGGNSAAGNDGCGVPDTGADSANDIIGFSSRGPCADGRKKPELVAPGTHVTGGVFQTAGALPVNGMADACFDSDSVCALPGSGTPGDPDNFFPLGQQWYTTSSGTSHSTPATSGAAALIRQHFINQALTPPSPAMTKALLMNTARYMNGVGANDTLWSNNQGMGEVHLNSFFDLFTTPTVLKDQVGVDTFTASGQTRIVVGAISDNTKPFRVTLTWTDVPGPTVGNAFVNNLDLEVTVGGQTFKGNIFTGAFSSPGGVADIRNNAESVFIPAGVSGTFLVKVKATNIAGDGVPNVGGALDQDFALVVHNAVEMPTPVIEGAGATITAESCSPPNGALDPNETVTVDFALQNIGTANTTNLVATLQATGGVTAPSGPQNYGVLVAGGPAVARPFTFTANGNCGDTITATLQLQDGATNLGTMTFTFTVGVLTIGSVTATYSSGNIAVPITDLVTTDIPITVSDVGVVSDINVRLRLNHTFDGDLDIFLVAPDGSTTVELSTDNGGTGDNYGSGANDCSGTKTVFDDSAATLITAGTAPFAGSFRPEQPLSTVNGLRSEGTWTLRIIDDASEDIGTVFCVELEISRRRFRCCGIPNPPEIMAAPPVTITAESCSPANNAIDPDETVTVQFPLKNVGLGDSTNLVATLQATGGVLSPSGPQSYGVVVADGPPVSRPFSFTASGACGGTITATFDLEDVGGFGPLGTVSFTLTLGATVTNMATVSNPAAIIIPAAGTGAASGAPANPYPSTINFAGLTGLVSKVTATITNLNHTFPSDVDILLVGPAGQKMILMSDVGGGTDAVNVTITFDDAAASGIGATVVSGTFMPTNSGTGDLFPAPAPAPPYGAALSDFNGTNPNGTWSLFVVDDLGGDIGNINGGWSLTIETTSFVCCVSTCTLICPAPITQSNDPNQCGAVVNYPPPTTSGGCGAPMCSPSSGSFFPVGTTTVNCTATPNGACSFTVTVVDTQPPTITCPSNVTAVTPVIGGSGAVVTFPPPTASDNCPGLTTACNPPSGSTFPVGCTTVTCTATDASGNTATCSFQVCVFNVCLQDGTNPNTVLLFNTFTGEYRFCCNGTLFTGTGKVTKVGSVSTLTHNPPDRRVTGKVDGSQKTGSGSLQFPPGTTRCTITDTNTANNTCKCP